jgi:pyruvate kinase
MSSEAFPFLISRLRLLEERMIAMEAASQTTLQSVHPAQRSGAVNLLHYLTLRSEDIRPIQPLLHNAGLSSLASAESHTLRQVHRILERMGQIPTHPCPCDDASGKQRLKDQARALFGEKLLGDVPGIMVTMDATTALNPLHIYDLLHSGMQVARINCAHDHEEVWHEMIDTLRAVSRAHNLPCKVYMDLAGPKIRTQILGAGRKKGKVKLRELDTIFLSEPGGTYADDNVVIGCTLSGIIDQIRVGDRVLFDDGKFEAITEKKTKGMLRLRVERVSTDKGTLKAEKGINFPDTSLQIASLTAEDLQVLPFALEHADLVGYSFVRTPADLSRLHQAIRRMGKDGKKIPAIILKIETREAVENLPALLVKSMVYPEFGVMIARGDLAVEIGFERLSEIQDQILWICEAGHIPVIWATQVLENLHKSGVATRSELTDAAHAVAAECVMINKGKHTLQVMKTLINILERSGGHHFKKTYAMRPLSIAMRYKPV